MSENMNNQRQRSETDCETANNQVQGNRAEGEANIKNNKASRRHLLLGLGGTALAVWHKPIINSVLTPAHAQTSPMPTPPTPTPPTPTPPTPTPPTPTPPVMCPMAVTGNVTTGPVSGTNVPPVCTATFDVFSSDAMVDIQISAIDAGTLPADVTIDVQDLGTATANSGPRVVWRGPATDAPFCSDLMPTDDITFTITLSCAENTTPVTQTIMLIEIIAP